MMKVLGIIPARGGSKRVKDKNVLALNGKPLIGYTIEHAQSSKTLDRVVVSTDSEMIGDVVSKSYDVEIIKRPDEYARDDSPIEEALLHACEYVKSQSGFQADIIVWMQANVPIRRDGIVDEVVEKLVRSGANSCVTCFEADQCPEVMKVINQEGRLEPLNDRVSGIRKQEFPSRYLLDGSVVALRAENLANSIGVREAHVYLGKDVIPIIQEHKKYTLEVDTHDDIPLIEYYLRKDAGVK